MKFFIRFWLSILIAYPTIGQELDATQEGRRREYLHALVDLLKTPGITLDGVWLTTGLARREGDSLAFVDLTEDSNRAFNMFQRKLIDSFYVHRYGLMLSWRPYWITIIVADQNVVAFGIVQEGAHYRGLSQDSVVYTTIIDSTASHHLLRSWRHRYGMSVDLMADSTSPYRNIVFGTNCGSISRILYPYKTMLEGVERSDTMMLRSWLRSMNLEVQAYGAEGLLILNALGIPTQEEDCELIESLILSNQEIFSCRGCVYGQWELSVLSDTSWMIDSYQNFLKKK